MPAGAFILTLAVLLGLSAAPAAAQEAPDNVVRVEPPGMVVAANGRFEVQVRTNPPDQSVAAWVVELAFDPAVITSNSEQCDPIDTPGGAVGASGCEVVDTDGDGVPDTAKIFGAVLFTRSERGLTQDSSLADITFDVEGAFGECTDLRLRLIIHADSDGEETGARVQDGRVCVQEGAPAEGTASPNPVTPRTNAPTPPPGERTGTPIIPGGNTDEPGTTGTGPVVSGGTTDGDTGSPGSGGVTGTRASGAHQTGDDGPGGVEDDDDGGSPLVWVVAALIVLVLAGAGAWALVRMRRPAAPPLE